MMEVPRKVRVRGLGTVRLRSSNLTLGILSALGFAFSAIILFYAIQPFPDSAIVIMQSAIGIIVLAATVIFFMLPILIDNYLTPSKLVLRYGVMFRLEIPLSKISKAETMDRLSKPSLLLGRGFRIGVEYSVIDRRFTVLRSKHGIVRIALAEEVEGRNWFVPKRVEEIVFDTLDSETLLKRIREGDLEEACSP